MIVKVNTNDCSLHVLYHESNLMDLIQDVLHKINDFFFLKKKSFFFSFYHQFFQLKYHKYSNIHNLHCLLLISNIHWIQLDISTCIISKVFRLILNSNCKIDELVELLQLLLFLWIQLEYFRKINRLLYETFEWFEKLIDCRRCSLLSTNDSFS